MYMYVIHIWHARIHRNFCQGGSRPDCQKTALKTVFFSPQLILQFYRGFAMVISTKTIIFQGLRGGQYFPGVVQLFPGGFKC